jgi:hypothetical protein
VRTRRRLLALAATAGPLLVAAWLVLLAPPASADNCDLRINPGDCQNTAWTVGSVAAVATAATAAAVAAGSAAAGTAAGGAAGATAGAGAEAEGEGEAEGTEAPGAPEPITEIIDGPRAMEVLQEMGLVRADVQPDGTVRFVPTRSFDELNAGGRTTFQETGSAIDPDTGEVVMVQEATITRIGGIAYTSNPDGSISNPVIIADRTPPGDWQHVRELGGDPNVRAQGTEEFVNQVADAVDAITDTNAGQEIMDDITASGQRVTVRPAVPGDGNSYGASRPFDRFENADGSAGRGTGGDVYWEPNRRQSGDGSQPWHRRPPEVGLAHEFAHARDAAQGGQALGTSTDPGMPPGYAHPEHFDVNTRELQATSIGPYAGHTSDENAIRDELGLVSRDSYVL